MRPLKFYITFLYLLVVIENTTLEIDLISVHYHLQVVVWSWHPNYSSVWAWQWYFSPHFFPLKYELSSYWVPISLLVYRCMCVCVHPRPVLVYKTFKSLTSVIPRQMFLAPKIIFSWAWHFFFFFWLLHRIVQFSWLGTLDWRQLQQIIKICYKLRELYICTLLSPGRYIIFNQEFRACINPFSVWSLDWWWRGWQSINSLGTEE